MLLFGAGAGLGVPLEEVGLEVNDLRGDLRGEVIVTAGERAMVVMLTLRGVCVKLWRMERWREEVESE